MDLRKTLLLSAMAVVAGAAATPAAAAPWQRGFVIGHYVYGFYYGGRNGYEKAGEVEPGIDCAHGATQNFVYDNGSFDTAMALAPWYTPAQLKMVLYPAGKDTVKDFLPIRVQASRLAIAHRGYAQDIETYVNPWAAADPGEPEVTGKIAEGFDLDDNPKTGGFSSPDGRMGIDNALYRAWGCVMPYRGETATLHQRADSQMKLGLYTMVIRISGNQDPRNDSDATVEIGYSPDQIIKNAVSDPASNYSYRIFKGAEYSKLKAKITNGVVETDPVAELHAPTFGWFPDQMGDADFHRGRMRLVIDADNNMTGVIGGYRDWRDIYAQNTFAQDGAQQDNREHEDSVALYFALKRNADGMPDPKTGQNMGISTAYRITGVPAYVIDPDSPVGFSAKTLGRDGRGLGGIKLVRDAFRKGVASVQVQLAPPGHLGWDKGEGWRDRSGRGPGAPAAQNGALSPNGGILALPDGAEIARMFGEEEASASPARTPKLASAP